MRVAGLPGGRPVAVVGGSLKPQDIDAFTCVSIRIIRSVEIWAYPLICTTSVSLCELVSSAEPDELI